MAAELENFLDELQKSVSSDSFIKLTLSNYKGGEAHLQKVSARVIETRRGPRMSFRSEYETRETTKNHDLEAAVAQVRGMLETGFRAAHLFTRSGDFQLTIGKRSAHLKRGRPTFTTKPPTQHDRQKKHVIDQAARYLQALGITTGDGRVRAQQQDKWRQINKYVEILGDLFDRSALKNKDKISVIDMGSGKGYLTFAAYDYFTNVRGIKVEMTGVEIREDLVGLCNQVGADMGFDGLKFVPGSIESFDVDKVDMLIALHACDTATDDALYKGITGKAEIIVAAPCCHKEIRRQMKPPDVLKDVLKHGTMLEREAETVTDGLRGLLLERSGYATKIFEFVASEHTPKNNMIAAVHLDRQSPLKDSLQDRIDALKSFYNIGEQRLENLLA